MLMGLQKIDFSCPDCLKSYDGVIIGGEDAPKKCECGCEFDLEGLFAGLACRNPEYCENCEYLAENEVCANDNSKNAGKFTEKYFQCDFHKFKEY